MDNFCRVTILFKISGKKLNFIVKLNPTCTGDVGSMQQSTYGTEFEDMGYKGSVVSSKPRVCGLSIGLGSEYTVVVCDAEV